MSSKKDTLSTSYQGAALAESSYQGANAVELSSSSFPTLEPSSIFYALGTAILIVGITSLVVFHVGIISACIVIGLGAEIMKSAKNDPKEIFENKECCGSFHATAIAAIVMASLELAAALIMIPTIIYSSDIDDRLTLIPSVTISRPGSTTVCTPGCLCSFDYVYSSSFFLSSFAFQWFNVGATVFDSILKISFCSFFMHLSKRRSDQGGTNKSILLNTGKVLYALGTLMISIGIITLLIFNFGFISSCILIGIGDTFMKASKSNKNNNDLTEKRGLFSLHASAIAGIVLSSIELTISFISLVYSYTRAIPNSADSSTGGCPVRCSCGDLMNMYVFADYSSYNLGASIITTVTKIALFWFTLRLTKQGVESFEQQQL